MGTGTGLTDISEEFDTTDLDDLQLSHLKQYSHDIKPIQTVYNRVVARHRAHVLAKSFEDDIHEKDVLVRIAKILLAKNSQPSIDEIKGLLIDDEVTDIINNKIKITRDIALPYKSQLVSRFNTDRKLFLEKSAKSIHNVLTKKSKLESLSSIDTDSESWSEWWYGRKAQALEAFILHHPDDVQGFNLIKVLDQMEFKDPSNLQLSDFVDLHQEIMKQKELDKDSNTGKLFGKYKEELIEFKANSEYFKDRLFYGYVELIEALFEHNRDQLEKIFG